MPQIPTFVTVIAAALVSFGLGWTFFRVRYEKLHGQARMLRENLVADAEKEARGIIKSAELEAKEELYRARQHFAK